MGINGLASENGHIASCGSEDNGRGHHIQNVGVVLDKEELIKTTQGTNPSHKLRLNPLLEVEGEFLPKGMVRNSRAILSHQSEI